MRLGPASQGPVVTVRLETSSATRESTAAKGGGLPGGYVGVRAVQGCLMVEGRGEDRGKSATRLLASDGAFCFGSHNHARRCVRRREEVTPRSLHLWHGGGGWLARPCAEGAAAGPPR
ncbi:hypothetical protein MRX96_058171 [Rhipicephalus microplus]